MVRILICDDDLSYQEILSFKIKKLFAEQLRMGCSIRCETELTRSLQIVQSGDADVLFLDVMLGEENAVDRFVSVQRSVRHIPCILMTAFPAETYNLSEMDCCYYLIKSRMTDEQLLRALRRAISQSAKKDPNLTLIRIGSKNYTINFQDLLYVESFNNNLTLYFADDSKMTIYFTLKKFLQMLPPNFLRCHKSYVVNMNHIQGFSPHFFTLTTGRQIPIPPKKYGEIVNTYRNYLMIL